MNKQPPTTGYLHERVLIMTILFSVFIDDDLVVIIHSINTIVVLT